MQPDLLTHAQDNNTAVAQSAAVEESAKGKGKAHPLDMMVALYNSKLEETKNDVDGHSAEVYRNQDMMKLIGSIIADINAKTDNKNCIDISGHPELKKKIETATELGLSIDPTKNQYDSLDRDRLMENLQLKTDEWNLEAKKHNQNMETLLKALDRYVTQLNGILKDYKSLGRTFAQNSKGS